MKTIRTSKSLNIEVDGQLFTVGLKDPRIRQIRRLIEQRKKHELLALLNPAIALAHKSQGRIRILRGQVLFNGRPANSPLAQRINATLAERGGAEALIAFADRLLANPSQRSADQAWRFLQHQHLPLLPNGHILAYKGIRTDWTDCHTGKIPQRIGQRVSMKREDVLNDPKQHCGPGLHVGSLEFARGYGQILLEVEVDPFDIVSVPEDAACRKLRTCGYTPLRVHTAVAQHQNETEKALVTGTRARKPFLVPEPALGHLKKVCHYTTQKLHGRAPGTRLSFKAHAAALRELTGLTRRELFRLIFKATHRVAFPALCRIRKHHG